MDKIVSKIKTLCDKDYIEHLEQEKFGLKNKLNRELNVIDNTNPSSYNPGFWGNLRGEVRKIILGTAK